MAVKYNFSPGPAQLPAQVVKRAKQEIWHWYSKNVSVMEVSHRSKKFVDMIEDSKRKLRKLLGISDAYTILFIQGGATMNYYQWCPNLLKDKEQADFAITGYWSKMSFREANRYSKQHLAFDSSATQPLTIPHASTWKLRTQSRFFHYIDNETVDGIEFNKTPSLPQRFLVSDMSSNIMTRKIDLKKFGLFYSGMQKNIGISGITLVVVRKSLLRQDACAKHSILFDYKFLDEKNSLANTPPNAAHYFFSLMLDWMLDKGGINYFNKQAIIKSTALYDAIDSSNGFYRNNVDALFRSRINIPFFTPSADLDKKLINYLEGKDLLMLKGHRVKGGLRANLYNSMPQIAVEKLIKALTIFKRSHG